MVRHGKDAVHPQLKPTLTLETALNELYQGRTNVAIQAARVGMSKNRTAAGVPGLCVLKRQLHCRRLAKR